MTITVYLDVKQQNNNNQESILYVPKCRLSLMKKLEKHSNIPSPLRTDEWTERQFRC